MFWNYLTMNEIDRYDGLNEIIVSVSLSAPKPGVFLDTVKYVLVIATTVEVVILAVSWNDQGNELKIIPTAYTIPTDNVTMFKVIGSQSGRIFMGGQDGLLYELEYDYRENKIASILGFDGITTKCQKRNHNAWSWRAVLPPFIRSMVLGDESLIDLVVDDIRHLLYAVTSNNHIQVVYLGHDNKATVCLINSFDLVQSIKLYLNYTGRNLDTVPRLEFFQDGVNSMQIVGFFIVPYTESKSVHAVAVLKSGVRVYLQLNTRANQSFYGPYQPTFIPQVQDAKFDIIFVRGPPAHDTLLDCQKTYDAAQDNGYLPCTANMKENKMSVSSSYYCNGVFLTAINNKDPLLPDELLGVSEDLTNRKSHLLNLQSSAGVSTMNMNIMNPSSNIRYDPLLPSLRESVTIINTMHGKQTMSYKVLDIKESCQPIHSKKTAPLWSLYMASSTPVVSEVTEQPNFKTIINKSDSSNMIPPSPLYYSNTIGSAGRSSDMGLTPSHITNITPLSEYILQSIPTATQREFLCLTRQGVVVIIKNRPIDYLAKCLLSYDGNYDNMAYYEQIDTFFKYFGHVESCAMCLEIICGLPVDLCVGSVLGSTSSTSGMSGGSGVMSISGTSGSEGKVLRDRAIRTILRFGGTAGFETIGRGSLQGFNSINNNPLTDMGNRDSRLAAGSLTPNFYFSHKYDAILVVISRILRPIWLRPVLDVSGKSLATIYTPVFLSTMISTLERFLNFLRDFYTVAVTRDVFLENDDYSTSGGNTSVMITGQQQSSTAIKQNMSYINSGLLTDRLTIHNTTTIQDPMLQFQKQALLKEDQNINGFWRVLHRTTQALTLLQILLIIQNVHKVPINWSELGYISFRALVVSPNIHDKIKKLLHTVIYQLCKSSDKRNEQIVNDVTKKLTEDCYLYFSAGDRFSYEAAKQMEIMRIELINNPMIQSTSLSLSTTSTSDMNIKSQTEGLIYLLLKASKYWVSLTDIKDEGADQNNVSQLTLYCNMLNQLGNIGALGIVHLCLSVAKNFDAHVNLPTSSETITNIDIDDSSSYSSSSAEWEKYLYHMGSILTDNDKKEGKELCYRCLIKYLELALKSTTATVMIDKILELSQDVVLREMVYKTLVNTDFEKLIEIQSADIPVFLSKPDMQHFNPHLLYRYYESRGMYKEAANYMYTLGHSEEPIPVESRLKYLQLAVDSATRVCEFPYEQLSQTQQQISATTITTTTTVDNNLMDSQMAYSDFLREVKDEVIVIGYQIEAYHDIQARRNILDMNLSEINRLIHIIEKKLLSISELFNDILLPFNLWTLALCLLQHSGLDAPDAVKKLWKSIIYRFV